MLGKIFRFLVKRPQLAIEVAKIAVPDLERVEKHIRRFERALEQCDKGAVRRAELEANLNYWLAVKAAQSIRPE